MSVLYGVRHFMFGVDKHSVEENKKCVANIVILPFLQRFMCGSESFCICPTVLKLCKWTGKWEQTL